MSKSPKNNVRSNESNQDRITAYLRVVESLDSPEAAESFRKAYPDHALSKGFKSKKQQRRHGK